MSEDKSSGVFNDADKEMEKSTDERFLRLEEDCDKAIVFFAGEPFTRYVYWDGQQTRDWYEGCGQKKALRLAMNVIVCSIENKKLNIIKVQVLEQGKRFYQTVSKRDKKYGIYNWLFEIERSGGKGDKETRYEIDTEHKLSDKEREKLMTVKLYDLEEFYADLAGDDDKEQHKPAKSSKTEKSEKGGDDDAIIDEEELNELLEMFKTLEDPEAAGRKFCDEFGIKRVKFLRKSQFKKGFKYVDRLTAPEHPDSDNEDVSPF